MEKLLKKDATFCWNEELQQSLDVLKEFHVPVDVSCVVVGVVLAQADEGELDHLIKFARRKLSKVENSYLMTECKGLAMVYMI